MPSPATAKLARSWLPTVAIAKMSCDCRHRIMMRYEPETATRIHPWLPISLRPFSNDSARFWALYVGKREMSITRYCLGTGLTITGTGTVWAFADCAGMTGKLTMHAPKTMTARMALVIFIGVFMLVVLFWAIYVLARSVGMGYYPNSSEHKLHLEQDGILSAVSRNGTTPP